MLNLVGSTQFKRDMKRAQKRGKDLKKLRKLVGLLLEQRALSATYKDHPLRGNWNGYRDVHIEPDWLLIYKVSGTELHLARTGTHSDLFEE